MPNSNIANLGNDPEVSLAHARNDIHSYPGIGLVSSPLGYSSLIRVGCIPMPPNPIFVALRGIAWQEVEE